MVRFKDPAYQCFTFNQEDMTLTIEEYSVLLRLDKNPFSEEMSSELEMARHEFEHEKAKLLRDINSLQEENYQLKIDVQIEKSRTEKVQKEAEITRKDLKDFHLENRKLRGKVKKEEKKAARAMIELRKKSVEFKIVSAELMTSQSKRQELK
ncbi:hypothetical protein Goshw_009555 [Gossypium schwendimanii]|uniref:Uncharacterized protein n=1 Tax=Gossypium schwendimanii TaxID=34291 RepID=A0A7J9MSN8_GOSSC|nr:hypothetical protein [Gossypium schwendimanii]